MLTNSNASKFFERLTLWNELLLFAESRPKTKFSQEEINKKRVIQMVVDGRLSAACASLISDALSETNEENLAKLLEKHPPQDIPEDAPSPNGLEQLKVSPQIILKMLRAFPKGSAAGPTGSSATHILHAVQVNNQTLALDILTDFVNLLASGLAPPEVQPFLAGAYLIGLSKKDGGICPIAIGDIYRRLTGKCLSALVKEEANWWWRSGCSCVHVETFNGRVQK